MEKCEKNKVAENRKGNDMSPPCFFIKKRQFPNNKKGEKTKFHVSSRGMMRYIYPYCAG
jgi:hypothetical protein